MKILTELEYQYKKLHDKLIFRRFWLGKQPFQKRPSTKTILVIRIDAIGDCIIWLDQAKEYRKAFPDYKLVLLHNRVWSDIAERLPWFDECISFDRSKISNTKYYKQLIKKINKHSYKKIFSPVYSRDFITIDWLVHNINAQEKIGYEGDYQNNHGICDFNLYYRRNSEKLNLKKIADSWYTTLVPNNSLCVMELQRNAHFIRNTINKNFVSHLPRFPFTVTTPSTIPKTLYAVFFLGASTKLRMWPIYNFVQIADSIPYNTIVLCGSANEKSLANNFLSLYKGNKTIIDTSGNTTIIQLIGIITHASLVITNETSASHIAVATRTSSICLLGGGHYGRFHPYQVDELSEDDKKSLPVVVTSKDHSCFGCNWICKHPFENGCWRCISDISVEDVILKTQFLNKSISQS